MKLILASNSKTRKDIFDMVGWKYEIVTSKVEEHSNSIDPEQYVIDLSKDKANSVASQIPDKALIVAADSIIYMDNKKFEKTKSKEEGFENIKKMKRILKWFKLSIQSNLRTGFLFALSSDAIILYGLLLDRLSISKKNK